MAWPYGSSVATIANGQALSGAAQLGGRLLHAIQMPSVWTSASMTFQASYDGATFANVYDQYGNELSVEVAASRFVALDPTLFAGAQGIKVRSGTSGAAVNQGQATDVALCCRDIT